MNPRLTQMLTRQLQAELRSEARRYARARAARPAHQRSSTPVVRTLLLVLGDRSSTVGSSSPPCAGRERRQVEPVGRSA